MGVQRLGQLFWLAGVVFFLTRCADARPFRGAVKWSFLLCKFSDAGTPPRDRAFYVSMFLGSQGLPDFFSKVTYNSITLDGSDVRGWYTMPVKIGDAAKRDRGTRMNDCINAAKSGGYTPPTGNLIAVITYPSNDLFGWPGWGAYFPYDASLGAYGHELGHGIGFEHSFSNDPAYRNADWAMIGEYDDPWDAMSYAHVYGTSALRPEYGDASPSYNAYHMDRMGWLPRTKVYTFGMKNETDATYMIEATNTYNPASPKTRICTTLRKCPPAYLMVRIPFDFNDRYHYYTVSLRLKTGYDAGIPYDQQFLIHEVKRFEAGGRAWYSSVLVRDLSDPAKRPATSLSANGVTISMLSKSSDTATVRIQSSFALRCKMGYVWRDARPGDTVCVTPDQRTLTWQENALADSRREPNGGAYGPNTCKQGYVWREAYAGDLVCVTPDRRTFNRNANAAASSLIDNKALSTYGPNTCKSGFVWREADNRDWVCVSPAVRTQARLDNAAKSSRRKPGGGAYGPNTCMNVFVWRDAFPGDYVCVVPSVRSQARTDNGQAPARLDLPMA